MIYGSVCSGIEAATVAWHPLGWRAAFFSEIEPFPVAVLAHHYPHVPNRGDMTRFREWPDADIDVLVGGTPCQSFSVAGLRKGLDDPRGNLALVYLALADRYRPRWLVWENVPGVLSSNGGRDFGAFLGALGQLGYGWAYRVLDARYFGVPQRRRRVFVVGHHGDWRRAAAVLFERASMSGHPAPGGKAREGTAPTIAARTRGGGGLGTDAECDGALIPQLARCVTAGEGQRMDSETETLLPVAHSLRAEGFDASEDGTGRGTPLVPMAFSESGPGWWRDGHGSAGALRAEGENRPSRPSNVVAFANTAGATNLGISETGEAPPITTRNGDPGNIALGLTVRRLTPRECERLQGFPDSYTEIPYRGKLAADGPRYRALGNSMAVPVMAWIGERIDRVERLIREIQEAA